MRTAALIALSLVLLVTQPPSRVPRSGEPGPFRAASSIAVADLDRDVRAFLSREMTAHLADIHQLDPPQTRVVGALTAGEYTWGTFMRALAVYGVLSGETTLVGRDSNEYARYVWDAAQIAGRSDLLDALRPTLKTQTRTSASTASGSRPRARSESSPMRTSA